jgi:hypothetical protein
MKKKNFFELATYLFILLFLYTAISKLQEFRQFRFELSMSPAPGFRAISPVIAYLLPPIEIITAIILFTEKWRMIGMYLSTGLMLTFTLYVFLLLRTHEHLPCTCGGLISQMSWSQHLYFNILFTLIGAVAILIGRSIKIAPISQQPQLQ